VLTFHSVGVLRVPPANRSIPRSFTDDDDDPPRRALIARFAMIENRAPFESGPGSVGAVLVAAAADQATAKAPVRQGAGAVGWIAAPAVVAAVLGVAYAPNLADLYDTWSNDPNYSHGFLVLPVALLILWRRVHGPDAIPLRPWAWAWMALAVVLVARALSYEWGLEWRETATLPVVLACLTLTLGGWPLLGKVWPAIAFLAFMLPLPPKLNGMLAQPLQHVATVGTCSLLNLTGLWVVPQGNIIFVDDDPLEVAEACNGLSMLMSLAATVAAATALLPMAGWKRVALLLSIVPIALASNILRIAATAWAYHLLGARAGARYAHDVAGWLMMPTALLLVGLELAALSWLIVRDTESDVGPRRRPRPALRPNGAN
jgi:exosortase